MLIDFLCFTWQECCLCSSSFFVFIHVIFYFLFFSPVLSIDFRSIKAVSLSASRRLLSVSLSLRENFKSTLSAFGLAVVNRRYRRAFNNPASTHHVAAGISGGRVKWFASRDHTGTSTRAEKSFDLPQNGALSVQYSTQQFFVAKDMRIFRSHSAITSSVAQMQSVFDCCCIVNNHTH